jgi:hypothetical protein
MSEAAKKYRCRTYTPRAGRGTGLRQKDDGGGVADADPQIEKYRCRTYTPAPARIVPSPERTMGWG